jgi:hypothetical protein
MARKPSPPCCADCRHYNEFCESPIDSDNRTRGVYGECKRITDAFFAPLPGEACVRDGSGYFAQLVVHEEFSCALFDDILAEYRETKA